MPSTGAVALPSLLERVQRIETVLRGSAADAERDRRLPAAAFEAMRDQGLYGMWRPRAFGGAETDPVSAFRVFEEVSRIDSAAGWNLQLAAGAEMFCAWFPDDGVKEAAGQPDTILAGSFFPPQKATPVSGGYRVTGRHSFVSGCQNASAFILQSHIYDGGAGPRMTPHGVPVGLMLLIPAREARIEDNWHTLGMRGTGSHDVVLEDIFVPEHRTAVLAPLDHPGSAYQGPLYKLTLWTTLSALSTVALGVARAAIDDLLALAARKTPAYTVRALRDRETVQALIGEAEGTLGAARAYLYEALGEAWDAALQGRRIDLPGKMKLQLAASHAVTASAKAVDLVHKAAGTSGIRKDQPFERHFRDVHTITQHAFVSAGRYESAGQYLLGVPIEWPFYGI